MNRVVLSVVGPTPALILFCSFCFLLCSFCSLFCSFSLDILTFRIIILMKRRKDCCRLDRLHLQNNSSFEDNVREAIRLTKKRFRYIAFIFISVAIPIHQNTLAMHQATYIARRQFLFGRPSSVPSPVRARRFSASPVMNLFRQRVTIH